VTFVEYLNILKKKTTCKAIAKEIKEGRQKEREDKQAKRIIDLGVVADYDVQRVFKNTLG
jgi:uncharacterized protein YdbL (DUF1318 family)